MLGLVKLGFAATVYPADARVTSKLPHRLFTMLVMSPLRIFMPTRFVRKLFPRMLGAVALEVPCVLGLVKHGFAATVYPADAQVILRLPGTSDQMCRLAPFPACSFACVTSVLGVVKTGFAAAVYPADAQVILRLLDTLQMTRALMPARPLMHSIPLTTGAQALVVDVVLGEVASGFAAPVNPADASVAALLPGPTFAHALLSALDS